MNHFDPARASPEAFADLKSLITIISDPEAAQAQADAIRAQLAEIVGQRAALAADREAFATEKAKARAEIEVDRASAARIMALAVEEKQIAATQRELAEAYAKKVGYWEPPILESVGPGSLTRAAFEDEPRSKPSPPANPSRLSGERFGQTTLTRYVNDEVATSVARPSKRH